jgi:uncharacterized iron-regulated membrane protein
MFGFWEILIILLLVGTVWWPWWQRRQAVKRAAKQRPRQAPPSARDVDYDDGSDEVAFDPDPD